MSDEVYVFPASPAQRRLWFLDQLQGPSAAYGIAHALDIRGPLNVEALASAFAELVQRHETLRTALVAVDGEPLQAIEPVLAFKPTLESLEDYPAAERELAARRRLTAALFRPFDLACAPLLRVLLLRLAPSHHVLGMALHHAVCDGRSVAVLVAELAHLYRRACGEPLPPLSEPPIQYADYAAWQAEREGDPTATASLAYWTTTLTGAPPLALPFDHPLPALLPPDGARHDFTLPAALVQRLEAVARGHGATPFMLWLAVWAAVLGRAAGQTDFCIGVPAAGRERPELERLIGLFANTLVLRVDLAREPALAGVLARMRATVLEAFAHQETPFEAVVEALKVPRSTGRSPLFQTAFALHEDPLADTDLPGLTVHPLDLPQVAAKFELTLELTRRADGGLDGRLEYSTAVFEAATARRFAEDLHRQAEDWAADPGRPLALQAHRAVTVTATPAHDTTAGDAHKTGGDALTPLESDLAMLWRELLGLAVVRRSDSFFDLGGHSLLACRLVARLRKHLSIELPVAAVFDAPTLAGLADRIQVALDADAAGSAPPLSVIEPTAAETTHPLSPAQTRLWFLHQMENQSPAYALTGALAIDGPLDVEVLRRAFDAMEIRHASLRTRFVRLDDEPVQVVGAARGLALPVVDLAPLPAYAWPQEVQRLGRAEARQPFDLAEGPLLRLKLLRQSARHHVLLVTLHHIIADGWSVELLLAETATLYRAFADNQPSPLPPLAIQYGDYAAWQRRTLEAAEGSAARPRRVSEGLLGSPPGIAELYSAADHRSADLQPASHEESAGSGATASPPAGFQPAAEYNSAIPGASPTRLDTLLAHWRERLAGLPTLELPTDRPRPPVQSAEGARHDFALEEGLSEAVAHLAAELGATRFHVLLAAFAVLLSRYSGQTDFAVGVPVAGRERPQTQELIGCFVNTVVLRLDLSGRPDFRTLVQRVRARALEAQAHQDLPFEKLVEGLSLPRDLSRHALFQVMFSHQAATLDAPRIPGLDVRPLEIDTGVAQFDLSLYLDERSDGLAGGFVYRTDLYDSGSIVRLEGHFRRLLAAALDDPRRHVDALPLMTGLELERLVYWNDTRVDFDGPLRLIDLIDAQAARTPEAIAVVYEDERLSYADLLARADALAGALAAAGVEPGQPVGVCLERSLELVVTLVAILRTGAAFMPLDPEQPHARLARMLATAKADRVVTSPALAPRLPEGTRWHDVAERGEPLTGSPPLGPGDPAYVLFTSGSTGTPKGAINSQRGIVNRLAWMQQHYTLGPRDRVLQKTPYTFDVSVWEFFWPLIAGARLVVARPGAHRDPGQLAAAIARHGITVLHFVPSMLEAFLPTADPVACAGLKRVFVSGEALSADLERRFFACGFSASLHNLYGPTEAAIDVTAWDSLPPGGRRSPPIGYPMPNCRLHILDTHGQPVPVGVPGELYLGGSQIGLGYLNQPGLTAERFLPDPFGGDHGARLYRSGDRARWLPDGSVEFLGRLDFQIKLRGQRIELGEIDAVLTAHPRVRSAATAVHGDDPAAARLVAYVVPEAGADEVKADLRRHLEAQLPGYMVPDTLMLLDALPLTVSGKLDRRRLPMPEPITRHVDRPLREDERFIAQTWGAVLGRESVAPDENFFEAGGTSLLLVQVHTRLKRRYPDLPLVDLFRFPTIERLAGHLNPHELPGLPPPSERRALPPADGIAIIGMACRFPGAADVEAFWELLTQGREAIDPLGEDDLRAAGVPEALIADPRYVRATSTPDDIDVFDAGFFAYSPAEAAALDPQGRLFLECAWQALEAAGQDPARAGGRIGVFAGSGLNTYALSQLVDPGGWAAMQRDPAGAFQTLFANDKDYLASRVAYKLGLTGPAVAVQTACSTSLVAVHLAARALIGGECRVALAGGASISVPARAGYLYQEGGIASADGHCRAFDAEAGGTVPGSGVGVVVLKRLADALADGDPVRGVIRGTAINNDGSAKVGFTAPGVDGQAAVIAMAQDAAGVRPAEIGYIEAHGTATPLGDLVEIGGLTRAFARPGVGPAPDRGSIALGSVKSNLGHLDAAAGVAGLVKATLAVERGLIPPSLHFKRPGERLGLEQSPFVVNSELRAWSGTGMRRAGVSAFGIGGTNAHVVIEQPPVASPGINGRKPAASPGIAELYSAAGRSPAVLQTVSHGEGGGSGAAASLPAGFQPAAEYNSAIPGGDLNLIRHTQLLPLSANSQNALDASGERLADWLDAHPEADLSGVAYTLQAGRRAFAHRRIVLAATSAEAAEALRKPAVATALTATSPPPVAFLFTGQGSQYPGMGAGLAEGLPVYRQAVERGLAALPAELATSLRQLVLAPAGGDGRKASLLRRTDLAQPALFLVEYALASQFIAWGVRPAALLGHSLGEWVAATLAGVFRLEDALGLVALRGRLMQARPPGAMLAVEAAADDLTPMLDGRIAIAAVNAPTLTVVSGDEADIQALADRLPGRGIACQRLHTSHAFHSPSMAGVAAPLAAAVAAVQRHPPTIPLLSNLTGGWLSDDQAMDPDYWARQLREPVRFADGLATLLEGADHVLVEIGPGRSLLSLARQHPACGAGRALLRSLPGAVDAGEPERCVVEAAGGLWLAGVDLDWRAFHAPARPVKAILPGHPLQRQRHWLTPRTPAVAGDGPVILRPGWVRLDDAPPAPDLRAERWRLIAVDDALAAAVRAAGGEVVDSGPADTVLIRIPDGDAAEAVIPGLAAVLAETHPRRLCLLTQGACDVLGDEPLGLSGAVAGAAALVAAQEYPGLTVRSLDLDAMADEAPTAAVLAALCAAAAPRHLALRRGGLWRPEHRPIEPAVGELPAGAVVLITGGFGKLGKAIAGRLATRGARLVLCGRHEAGDGNPAIQALRAAGAEVMTAGCDVGDPAALTAVIAGVRQRFGRLDAVVHAAGVAGEAAQVAMADTDGDTVGRLFRAKLDGTRALAAALGDAADVTVLLCSSLATVLGGLGFAAYAGANAAMDTLAVRLSRTGGPRWLAVDWDGWRFGDDAPHGLAPATGAALAERLLASGLRGRVLVTATALGPRLARWVEGIADTPPDAPPPPPDGARAPGFIAPRSGLEEVIAEVWREALGLPEIGVDDDFFALGGHSLLAVRMLARLQEIAGVPLSLRVLLEAPTVARQARMVDALRWQAQGREAEGAEQAISDDEEDGEI